jgi:hypothetical protein
MEVSIELPDLLSKLKLVSYAHYQLERVEQAVYITLFAGEQAIRYHISHPLSLDKQAEVGYLLEHYRCS